jgi:glutamyl-tRNA reductase
MRPSMGPMRTLGMAPPGLIAMSIDHRRAETALRERAALGNDDIAEFLTAATRHSGFVSGVVLSTCNRVELYMELSDPSAFSRHFKGFFAETRVDPSLFDGPWVAVTTGETAANHLFRVTSGLESMMLGEMQIVAQVKEAVAVSHEARALSPMLSRLFQTALRTSKRVRTETQLDQGAVSVAFAAVELARKFFDDMSQRRAVLVGAGETGALAGKHFIAAGIGHLTVLNRSIDRAQEVAAELHSGAQGTVKAAPMASLKDALSRADVVLCSTASPTPVVMPDVVLEAMRKRPGAPLFMLDIAVPRDVHPAVSRIADVFSFGIDDLSEIVRDNLERRRREVPRAEALVSRDAAAFTRWCDAREVSTTVGDLHRLMADLKAAEMARYNDRLPPETEALVDRTIDAFIKRVMHRPASHLRGRADENARTVAEDAAALRRLFKLDEPDDGNR